jgi:hypothetical protein
LVSVGPAAALKRLSQSVREDKSRASDTHLI